MPLLVMCGAPCSGKSKRVLEIKEFLEKKGGKNQFDVKVISEEGLNISKLQAYESYSQEKMTRAFLKSNVEKNLNPTTIVIFDSLNYIKGYRYELYCLARSCYTSLVVVNTLSQLVIL